MPCPHFEPRSAASMEERVPLGRYYAGRCHAAGEPFRPAPEVEMAYCNLGYPGRGCPQAPSASAVDATRFNIVSEDGGLIKVRYARERDHHPVDCGTLEFLAETQAFAGGNDDLLESQARAYVESFLARKSQYKRIDHV